MLKRLERMISFLMRITTWVLFVTAVYITVFFGWEIDLGVEILWQILSVSAITSFGSLIYPVEGEKEISKRRMLTLHILYFTFVNLVVLLMGWHYRWFHLYEWKEVAGMLAAILFVYVMVMISVYLLDLRMAEKMNRKLKERE